MSLTTRQAREREDLGSVDRHVEYTLPPGLAPPAALVNAAILAEKGKDAIVRHPDHQNQNRFNDDWFLLWAQELLCRLSLMQPAGQGAIAALVALYADAGGETRAVLENILLPTAEQEVDLSLERPLGEEKDGLLFMYTQSRILDYQNRLVPENHNNMELHLDVPVTLYGIDPRYGTSQLTVRRIPRLFGNSSEYYDEKNRAMPFTHFRYVPVTIQRLFPPSGSMSLKCPDAHIVVYLSVCHWLELRTSGGHANSDKCRIALFYLSMLVNADLEMRAHDRRKCLFDYQRMSQFFATLPQQARGVDGAQYLCRTRWRWASQMAKMVSSDYLAIEQAQWELRRPVLGGIPNPERFVYDVKQRYLQVFKTVQDLLELPPTEQQPPLHPVAPNQAETSSQSLGKGALASRYFPGPRRQL
ncbi:hypothetical protein JCM11641_003223 [Rhodosporidiobolus odoratus]